MKIVVDYPTFGEEAAVVGRSLGEQAVRARAPDARATSSASRRPAASVLVDRDVIGYAVALADATRNPARLRARRPRAATSSTAPARAGRSASCRRRARWRCCAAAAT